MNKKIQPYCRGLKINDSNSLATRYHQLITEWVTCIDDTKLATDTITPGSNKKLNGSVIIIMNGLLLLNIELVDKQIVLSSN